jgi:hypothetical protein
MIQRSSLTALWPSQRGITNRSARTKPQQAFLAILLIIGITLVLSLYLLQASKITVRKYDIRELQVEMNDLQQENANTLAVLAYEQSITQMDKRAVAAGFKPTESVLYLPVTPEQNPERFAEESPTFTAAAAPAGAEQAGESVSMRTP